MQDGHYLLRISSTSEPGASVAVVRVEGEVDMAVAALFRAALEERIHPHCDLVVDLAGVTFLDAAGVGVLLEVEGAAREVGRTVRIRNATGIVARVLQITGTDWMVQGLEGCK